MKVLGAWIMSLSALMLVAGAVFYFGLSKPSTTDSVLLDADQASADLCLALKRLDRYDGGYTDCSKDVSKLEERMAAQARHAETFALPGLIMMSSGPFLFLVGLILFVGGRLEKRSQ